jgi:uncharacterized membrane protein
MKLWKLLDIVCAVLSLPALGSLGVMAWIILFGGQAGFAWPATALLIGTVGLFLVLQTISNELQDAEIKERYRR